MCFGRKPHYDPGTNGDAMPYGPRPAGPATRPRGAAKVLGTNLAGAHAPNRPVRPSQYNAACPDPEVSKTYSNIVHAGYMNAPKPPVSDELHFSTPDYRKHRHPTAPSRPLRTPGAEQGARPIRSAPSKVNYSNYSKPFPPPTNAGKYASKSLPRLPTGKPLPPAPLNIVKGRGALRPLEDIGCAQHHQSRHVSSPRPSTAQVKQYATRTSNPPRIPAIHAAPKGKRGVGGHGHKKPVPSKAPVLPPVCLRPGTPQQKWTGTRHQKFAQRTMRGSVWR